MGGCSSNSSYGCVGGKGSSPKRVLIIGAGVIGMTTALKCCEAGFDVTVVASEFAPPKDAVGGYTSVVAGALWEYPPGVCGRHDDETSIGRAKQWSLQSYREFNDLCTENVPGVKMLKTNFYFKFDLDTDAIEVDKMDALKKHTFGFKRGLKEHKVFDGIELNLFDDIVDAYSWISPHIETNEYMEWLTKLAASRGVTFIRRQIDPVPLVDQENILKKKFNVDCIINCSGLGSIDLVPDKELVPLRGALVRLINDGKTFPKFNESFCVQKHEQDDGNNFIFIVPRGPDRLILGGITEENEWSRDCGLEYEPFREMYEANLELIPALRGATLDPKEPVHVGLRPFSKNGAQLYRQKGTNIVHCYGHGGAGFCWSFGCANEVVEILEKMFQSKLM